MDFLHLFFCDAYPYIPQVESFNLNDMDSNQKKYLQKTSSNECVVEKLFVKFVVARMFILHGGQILIFFYFALKILITKQDKSIKVVHVIMNGVNTETLDFCHDN